MKIRQLIKGFGGALVAAVLIFSASANADPVTQLIHFDDATNGWKWYSDVDNNFLFDPTNLQSGNCADSTNGGNGSCVIEQTQDNLPLMTRREFGPYSQGQSGNNDPDVSGEYWPFTLDSFYFFLTGKGSQGENALTITGGYGTPQTGSTVSKTFLLGSTYSEITYYDDEVGNPGDPAGALAHNIAYIASFGDFFADVTWIKWNSASSAQVRLDCVVATFDGTTTQPLSGYTGGCGGGTTQVAEPGTLALLGLGLFGIGLMRRRRKV